MKKIGANQQTSAIGAPNSSKSLRTLTLRDLACLMGPSRLAVALLMFQGLTAPAQTYLVDFGSTGSANTTTLGSSPNDPQNYWNNLTTTIGQTANGVLTNLVSSLNQTSAISIKMISRFNGANTVGTTLSTLYPVNSTKDSLYGNTESFNSLTNIFPSFKLTGLATNTTYSLSFFASRSGASDNRETGYSVSGANSNYTILNASTAIDNTGQVQGVLPSAAGEIIISLAPTPANNSAQHFTYLGVLQVDAIPPQTPLAFNLEPVSKKVQQTKPVTFSCSVTGSPPYTVQWYENGSPIAGWHQFYYTVPSADLSMNGYRYSVTVSNLVYAIASTNAVLTVLSDTNPPTVIKAASYDGGSILLTFSEPLEVSTPLNPANYIVNAGAVPVSGATLVGDSQSVVLALSASITGSFTVVLNNIQDIAGNTIAPNTSITGNVVAIEDQSFLLDFGGANTTEVGPSPDDPNNFWNNVNSSVSASDTGELQNLVSVHSAQTTLGLVMIRRFNGINENGTLVATVFPQDAARDSMYGNTEAFSAGADFFPSFKLTGLNPGRAYNLTFYASRADVTDNRETGYTVVGANAGFTALNAANNVDNTAKVEAIFPTLTGEVSVSLAPTTNNNNANHFTYLGVLQLSPGVVPPQSALSFTKQPVSQRVAQLKPVTFTCEVAGPPPYFVQWYENGQPVSGANGLSYKIDAAQLQMNGAYYAVTVSNLVYGVRSTNAVLTVNSDTNPPSLIKAVGYSGTTVELTFSEPLDATTAIDPANYKVDNGVVAVIAANLSTDGLKVTLTLDTTFTTSFGVEVRNVLDLAGNLIASSSRVTGSVVAIEDQDLLIDFGGASLTLHGASPDDPINYWNSISTDVGAADTGVSPNLVTSHNTTSLVGLSMISRFGGANTAGTTASALFPQNATRDTLYGNTEVFSGASNIFPSFKLTGLNPARKYDLTFFASRIGVSDIRETGYSVSGANSNYTRLNAANNINNTAQITGMSPNSAGEITISLAPTPANNNANHFTYLGILQVSPYVPPLQFLPSVIEGGKIKLQWTGIGQLERALSVNGSWTPITPAPTSPYQEDVVAGEIRFYRLKK